MDKEKQVFYREEEEEINLIELMIQLLSGWKKIVILALLFAALLGGYKAVSSLKGSDSTGSDMTEAEEKYQNALETYELQKSLLADQIESTSDSIQENMTYREHSVLMQLDPYNYAGAFVVYYIDAHYTVDPNTTIQNTDPSGSLVRAYETKLQTADFYQYLAEIPGLDGQLDSCSFEELVSIQAERDTRMLTINVAVEDQTQADVIVEAVQQYVLNLQSGIAEKIADHDLQILTATSYWMSNGGAADIDNGAVINTLDNVVAIRQQEFESNLQDLNQQLVELQTQKSELEKPEELDGIAKKILKFILIGFVLGAFIACGWITLKMLLGDLFYDEEDLQQRYGLAILGSLRRFSDKGIINKICAALSCDKSRQSDLIALTRLAQANVAARLRKQEAIDATVLLVGSENEKFLNMVAELSGGVSDGVKYQLCGNILEAPAAVAMLQPGVRVVICEEKGNVSRQTILKELQKLQSLGCDVLGIISL